MARRCESSTEASFLNDSKLRQYFLDGVVSSGKTLGVGSYGSVLEVEYRQVSCAAKRMHELLLDPGNEGVTETIETYRRECQLMAGLRHPNITQFLGLCFLEGSNLPLLVMEKLKMSVDDLLDNAPAIPLPVKISILTDTCSGLVYLHSMESPIVHRDLTARNVLLTTSLTAKITDLGNSRMVIFRPGQPDQTLSKNPGTTVYMPPEALSESHRYGPSLDVFSFGHLALYTLTQKFPGQLLSANYTDPNNPEHLIGRTEVERRGDYMRNLEQQLNGSYPVLVQLVTQCLHNTPQTRPSSQQLLGRLLAIKHEIEDKHGGSMGTQLNISNILLLKEMKEKDKTISRLQASEARLEAEHEELVAAFATLEAEKTSLITDKSKISDSHFKDNLQHENEKAQLTENNHRLEMEINKLKFNYQQLQCHFENCKAKKHSLENQLKELQQQLDMYKESQTQHKISHMMTFPLQLDWRRGPDMPVDIRRYIQSIVISGTVYVGGGGTYRNEDGHIVMAYSTQSCKWNSLPPYTTRWFAMTTINRRLVLVGGVARDSSDSCELGEWQPDSNQWTHPFPPMSTPRYDPSATSYKQWLVVAGGCHVVRLNSIEILDVSNMQWSTGPSTPTPWVEMKSTTLRDTCYFMGGYCTDDVFGSRDVYSVSLEALISQSASDSSNIWKKLPSLDRRLSCPLIIGGSLLAVGGQDMSSRKPVSTIQHYVPETNTWVQAGLLPHAVCNCTCVMTSDKLHLIGGEDKWITKRQLFTAILQ